MRFVSRILPASTAWMRWKRTGDSLTTVMIAAWKTDPTTKPPIGKHYREADAKAELIEIFHGKCAYCEVRLTGNQPGDVEHYRPKAGLKDKDNRPIKHPGTGRDHDGYFWLAYEWFNLLISCNDCNKLRLNAKGERCGKGERFPIANESARAYVPGKEIHEEPLLLNPVLDDPAGHLEFDIHTGLVSGLSMKGKATIDLLALNRDGLKDERLRTCRELRGLYALLGGAAGQGNDLALDEIAQTLDRHRQMLEPYSAIAVVLMKEAEEKLWRALGRAA